MMISLKIANKKNIGKTINVMMPLKNEGELVEICESLNTDKLSDLIIEDYTTSIRGLKIIKNKNIEELNYEINKLNAYSKRDLEKILGLIEEKKISLCLAFKLEQAYRFYSNKTIKDLTIDFLKKEVNKLMPDKPEIEKEEVIYAVLRQMAPNEIIKGFDTSYGAFVNII